MSDNKKTYPTRGIVNINDGVLTARLYSASDGSIILGEKEALKCILSDEECRIEVVDNIT